MQVARRLEQIGAYLFADLDRKQAELTAKGVDVINLGIGDPDLPTPPHIIDALMEGATDPRSHRYPPYPGTQEFKEAAARWCQRRVGITPNSGAERIRLVWSPQGPGQLPRADVKSGACGALPHPRYPG